MTKEVVEQVRQLRERNRYVVGLIGWVGFRHGSVAVKHGKRFAGQTKYDLSKQIELAVNAILSFSAHPLEVVIRTGLFFVFVSLIGTLYVVINKLVFNRPVLGWSSLLMAILLLGGIQIIILGVLGEYVGRNYIETKNRPLYIVKKKML